VTALNDSVLSAVGMGESLLRLSTPGHERLGQSNRFDAHVGGAEMNVLITLSAFGFRSRWLTRMADNAVGRLITSHAAAHGVELVTDWDLDARAPLYFVEHGAHPRPSEVLYDRSSTAMTRLDPSTFPWKDLVEGTTLVLSSGITCAIGQRCAAAVAEFFDTARQAGAKTVFDVNYRTRLWSWEEARSVLRGVLGSVDVLSATRHDLLNLVEDASGEEDTQDLARRAIERWGHQMVFLRETTHPGPGLATVRAAAVTDTDVVTSAEYGAQIIDSFGAGDASLGAFLATWLSGGALAQAVDISAWAAAFHQTVAGDAWQGRSEDLHLRLETRKVLR
jgi:2-dehydro-3-deoxygluconokinase